MFYPLVFIGTTTRACYLFMDPVMGGEDDFAMNSFIYLLNFFPSLTYISGYLVVLFCWARIYHNSYESNDPLKFSNMRVALIIINIAMYITFFALFTVCIIVDPPENKNPNSLTYKAVQFLDSALFLGASLGFVVYALLIQSKMKGAGLYSHFNTMVKQKIHWITATVVIAFILRAGLIIWDSFVVISDEYYVEPLYYIFLELIPLWMMVYILRVDSVRKSGKTSYLLIKNHRQTLVQSV